MFRLVFVITLASAWSCDLPPSHIDRRWPPDSDTTADTETESDSGTIVDTDTSFSVSTETHFDDKPWRFVALSDSQGTVLGVNVAILSEMVEEIIAQGAEVVIFPGDLVSSGTSEMLLTRLETWRDTMMPVYDAGIAVYPIRGNNDLGNAKIWKSIFSGPYAIPDSGPKGEVGLTFAVTHRNALIVGLDAYVKYNRINQMWLDAKLATNIHPHIFVFSHPQAYPPVSTGALDNYPDDRDAFWDSLVQAGARTYFCGHGHYFAHARLDDGDGNPNDDIHQLVVGTAGGPLYTSEPTYSGDLGDMTVEQRYHLAEFGYLTGDVEGLHVTLTFWRRDQPGEYSARHFWSYSAI